MPNSATYQAKLIASRRREGLCIECGKRKPARARTRCTPCLRLACEHQAVRRAEARGEGLCCYCGERVRIPVYCDRCTRKKGERKAEKSPPAVRKQARAIVGTVARGRQLRQVLASILLLRTGRWTIAEWSAELGMHLRTTYRLLTTLRQAGIEVEVSREREHQRGTATPLYRIRAEAAAKALGL
jgi:hypothetical protein